MTGKYSICVSLLSMLIISGCASFQGNNLQPVKSFPKTSVKKTVYVDLTFKGIPMFWGNEDYERRRFEKICIKRMAKSSLFGAISTEEKDSDIDVAITMHSDLKDDNALVFRTHKLTCNLKAIVTDKRSGQKVGIQLQDSMGTVFSIFSLPFAPFCSPFYVGHKLSNKLFDNLCIEIYKTGMLEEAEPLTLRLARRSYGT